VEEVTPEVLAEAVKVEEVKQENGKVIKEMVGSGYMDVSTNGSIHIKLGGCSDILILG
jgi:hypothetical protein